MGTDSSTSFPPGGQPKENPKETLGKTMQELTDEKAKKGDGSIKYAKPGKSDILP